MNDGAAQAEAEGNPVIDHQNAPQQGPIFYTVFSLPLPLLSGPHNFSILLSFPTSVFPD